MWRRAAQVVVMVLAVLVGIVVPAGPASAEILTWQAENGVPGFWSRSENWVPERAPVAGDDLVFGSGSDCGANDITPRLDVRSVAFGTNCQVDGEGIGITSGVNVLAPRGFTAGFLFPVTLLGDQTWSSAAADMLIDDTVDLGGHTLTFDGGGNVIPAWFVGGGRVVKRGSGRLFLRDGSTSDSPLDIQAGDVDLHGKWSAPITMSSGRLGGPGEVTSIDASGGTVWLWTEVNGFPPVTLTTDRVVLRGGAILSIPHRQSQLVTGSVTLDNPVLDVGFSTNRELADGAIVRVIDNRGGEPVHGTFADLPDGAVVMNLSGERFQITYRGGDGNDVDLRFLGSSECGYPPPWPPSSLPRGYRLVAADGGVFAFGAHPFVASGALSPGAPTVGIAASPTKLGYWIGRADASALALSPGLGVDGHGTLTTPKPMVGITSAPFCGGFWQVGADGGVYAFGRAQHYGGLEGKPLNQPIVGMATTSTGRGYWLAARDGGIFSFGDAAFHGSTGAMRLNQPIVGVAGTPSGRGYWLVASDGGIFTFGDAVFYGSTGAMQLNQPIVGMARTPTGRGYWLVARDGGVFTFGDATFHGSTGDIRLNQPIVGMAA